MEERSKKAIIEKNKEELKKEIGKLEKVKEFKDEKFEQKEYLKELNLKEAKAVFKHRAKMTQYVKRNFSNDIMYRQSLWQCISCKECIDTQSHMMWCISYSEFRENLNFNDNKDLASYIAQVLKIREKMEKGK